VVELISLGAAVVEGDVGAAKLVVVSGANVVAATGDVEDSVDAS
jgi:hypothetical protein